MSEEIQNTTIEEASQQDAATTGNATGQQQTAAQPTAATQTFSQADIDRIIGERLARAQEKWQIETEKKQQKAAEKAQAEELAKKQEWEELAKKHAARVAELEPLQAQVEQYQTTIDGLLQQRVEVLGERAKAAVESLPGNLDALARLEWLNKNESLFTRTSAPSIDADKATTGTEEVEVPQEFINEYAARWGVNPQHVPMAQIRALYLKQIGAS